LIQKKSEIFLGISDPTDTRIAGAFCKILDEIDIEEYPLCSCTWKGKSVTVVMLSPDAHAKDIETLEAKALQPTSFMAQIADHLLTGTLCIPYD